MQTILSVAAGAAVVLVASAASGGEINATHGVAIQGYDPVAYFTQHKPVKGSKTFVAQYKGAEFHFASAKNRDAFLAAPVKYAPQYGGFCAFGTAKGYKAPIDPAAFTLTGGKLYLNYDQSVQQSWRKDIDGFVDKADKNWPTVKTQ